MISSPPLSEKQRRRKAIPLRDGMRRERALFARHQCRQRNPSTAGAAMHSRSISAALITDDLIGYGG